MAITKHKISNLNKCLIEVIQFISALYRQFWLAAVMCRFYSQILIKMDKVTKQIFDVLVKNQETCKIGSDGDYSQEQCVFAWDFELVAEQIATDLRLKELQHHKDTTVGLYATDKEPEKLFEEIFVNLIEEIGMDGEKTFSAMDYDYYKEMFNRGIKLLMFRVS